MNKPKIKMFKILSDKTRNIYYIPSYNKESAITKVVSFKQHQEERAKLKVEVFKKKCWHIILSILGCNHNFNLSHKKQGKQKWLSHKTNLKK